MTKAGNTYQYLEYSAYLKKPNLIIIINNDKYTGRMEQNLALLLEVIHCVPKLQMSQLSASR